MFYLLIFLVFFRILSRFKRGSLAIKVLVKRVSLCPIFENTRVLQSSRFHYAKKNTVDPNAVLY